MVSVSIGETRSRDDGIMEERIIRLIEERGPLTGTDLYDALEVDGIVLWQTCKRSGRLLVRSVGTHYLRLDRRLERLVRLSPSIWREFLTYSVIGLRSAPEAVEERAEQVRRHIEEVSRAKVDLVYRIVSGLGMWLESEYQSGWRYCFIIAGDIVYNMAHDVPRPERSTGRLVQGSDMDLVVIVEDGCPAEVCRRIDAAIFEEKSRLLMTPHLREEIDYVVKDLSRVREQMHFDDFKRMVACKILHEGAFLYGDEGLFQTVKALLRSEGVLEKLLDMERSARIFRRQAEEMLLTGDPDAIRLENLSSFYPAEESEEFE